jgi:hypothetical protein
MTGLELIKNRGGKSTSTTSKFLKGTTCVAVTGFIIAQTVIGYWHHTYRFNNNDSSSSKNVLSDVHNFMTIMTMSVLSTWLLIGWMYMMHMCLLLPSMIWSISTKQEKNWFIDPNAIVQVVKDWVLNNGRAHDFGFMFQIEWLIVFSLLNIVAGGEIVHLYFTNGRLIFYPSMMKMILGSEGIREFYYFFTWLSPYIVYVFGWLLISIATIYGVVD